MRIQEFTLTDISRLREIPVCAYLPEHHEGALPVVIFNPGYRDQEDRGKTDMPPAYKNYAYLAEFFTQKGYAFISIEHDLITDTDGLETIDPQAVQHEAREYLFKRGVENINYVLHNLPSFDFSRFIIAGHSNGGDIAKYFANLYPEKISCVIAMDARRCRIEPGVKLRVLMFEADDTTTDNGVLPDAGKRDNLEWVVVKPGNAVHVSYNNASITAELRRRVCSSVDWFLTW